MKKFIIILVFFVAGSVFLSGCSQDQKAIDSSGDKLNAMVSVLPQVDFVERIGDDRVTVSEIIPPGFSPATYDPSPEQLQKLQEAKIYFRIGHIPFEEAQMINCEK
jgi:zinc transport system substrate-binding protein